MLSFYGISQNNNFTSSNNFTLAIILVAISMCILQFIKTLDKGIIIIKAKVIEVLDSTTQLESVTEGDKGIQTELTINYEFKINDQDQTSSFVVLVDKDKLEELRPNIPDLGNQIPIFYNKKQGIILDVFIPELKPYMKSI